MALEAEGRRVGDADALQRTVKQRFVRDHDVLRQAGGVHFETVVLAGDHHAAGLEVLHRVVGTVMAEFHFAGFPTGGDAKNLMAETDAEHRQLGLDEFTRGGNGVGARLGITGAVRQQHPAWFELEHVSRRSLRRHHGHSAPTVHQHAQDVAFDAEIVGDDMETLVLERRFAVAHEFPRTGLPHV